ncbi:hypermethylated in cancer 2 protein-like [Rhopalosiphum maidis]|uniref:hypermethylated in cancer 2 protein-like n=1 Tax=Rhopalosiphum maidis TaxID=43146 RepID=UPI000F00373C|nr:hypermethylated in cancer 2 protein-like [Rhopalosiphum maidis]
MFSCSVCDKTLTRICSLRRHAKSHDVSNKISCNICSQVFTRRDNLIRHSKEKHRSNIVIQPTNLKPTEQIYDYEGKYLIYIIVYITYLYYFVENDKTFRVGI